jgi:O-antigen/teichoic acid export membrane protein
VLLNALATVPYTLIQAAGRPDLTAKFHLIELPLHVVLAWLLVTRFGIAGAALAWTLRMAVDAALLFVAASRLGALPAKALADARGPRAALLLAATGAAVWAAGAAPHALRLRAPLAVAALAAAAALAWTWVADDDDRERIVRLVRRAPPRGS